MFKEELTPNLHVFRNIGENPFQLTLARQNFSDAKPKKQSIKRKTTDQSIPLMNIDTKILANRTNQYIKNI